jgi:hypothetical protein
VGEQVGGTTLVTQQMLNLGAYWNRRPAWIGRKNIGF